MKFFFFFCLLCVLCASALNVFALDREAFTFTDYDLNVRIEPEQQRLAVRGKITLRNDSQTPLKIAVLQVSSSLDWRSIRAGDKPLQYVTQPYASDIDHTGALSEAIVTLAQEVAPRGSVTLDIAYEGVVTLDATRLTRIGAPEETAKSADWDQISAKFTAIRGVGYVAWYPIATGVANLSEGNSLLEVLGRWKARESAAKLEFRFDVKSVADEVAPVTLCGGTDRHGVTLEGTAKLPWHSCSYQPLGLSVPAFAVAEYQALDRPKIKVYYLPEHAVAAAAYADAAVKASTLITEWLGAQREVANTADLLVPDAGPFESGALLLTPFASADSKLDGLAAAHQLAHASFLSLRPWIEEGLGHFLQAVYLEQEKRRPAALDYMRSHLSAFREVEKPTAAPRSEDETNNSLVNTTREDLYRSKAMCVWWMLRDMIGDAALKKALAAYKPEQDREPSYMPRSIQAQASRDLEWFFDDWVYRDRGLPDFKVESAFSRKTMTDLYILTVTVDNLGAAGAEVPVTVTYAGGTVTKRLEVRGKSKAVTRVEVTGVPQEVVVNDGSVPESDMTNNVYKIDSGKGETTEPAK